MQVCYTFCTNPLAILRQVCYTYAKYITPERIYLMRTQTFVLDSRYPDCTLTTYIHEPFAELQIPSRRAIIVCPGGGYQFLSDRESEPVALQYFAAGLNVFILRYSVQEKAAHDAPLIEAALAVKYVRDHAEEYFIDPAYVFITGFSAGGHCAAMCGILWNHPVVREALGIDRGEAPEGINKPTATVLCYPVITGGPYAHRGSIDSLCGGPSAGTAGADRYSLELHVDATTAPAFIWHTFNDGAVPIQNTLLYAQALAAAGVPFEYHVYPDGVHGLSLCNRETSLGMAHLDNPVCAGWLAEAIRYVTEFRA